MLTSLEKWTRHLVMWKSRHDIRSCAIQVIPQVVCGGIRLGKVGEVDLDSIWVRRVAVCEKRGEVFIFEVVCNRSLIMVGKEPSSLSVRVFMIEDEALWYKFEHVDSQ